MTDALVSSACVGSGKDARILDCTLRDGSYSVDFQFSESSIISILAGLEACGIPFIEFGHGLGLGAGEALGKPMLVSDYRCFELAWEHLRKASWGMFCIPGIAALAHLRDSASAGMQFVRVGVEITDVSPAREFIELGKELGLTVFANLMKTALLPTRQVIAAVQTCAGYGADCVYLVDSFGSFVPSDVAELFGTVGRSLGIPLGFHGHNNLGLANANALFAVESGAAWIDSTLDGIGRDAGNTVTESLPASPPGERAGEAYDYRALGHLSQKAVRPLPRVVSDRAYQLVASRTRMHSSFFPLLTRCAEAAQVDVFGLMTAVAGVDRVNPSEALVMDTARSIAQSRPDHR